MSKTLNVALVQTDLVWEDPEANRRLLDDKINALSSEVDLIVFPEMFTSGFTMNPSAVAETMEGRTIEWLKEKAKEKQAVLMGSLVITENDNFYNRMVCVEPSGAITKYDKRHTFTLANEHKVYTAGTEKVIFEYKGWKICPLVCYDLRFPVWARNVEDYDLLVYIASWPKVRITAWDTLLKARAIENMTYCIGVNRVGLDGNNHEYSGHSVAYDVLGNRLDTLKESEDATEIVTLKKDQIKTYRDKLSFLKDRDSFSLKV
ncbi:putative amidohydrolase [Winogradskyella epiphytica]|uniref:Omega-amidase YafV n=1 Tax=Winogradskyella epiphytica TaxID=262005 RepID=A0A2V4XW39_9FLAO|nr:amidohydrolase [Winogradskyella epiphytica]PYE83027.1 putative amidohydrolase [Winogradskyella epiphytica]GGW55272.1 carbon-nitrogen hydrolase [Winogradskyella epiphytica]